VDRKLRSVEVLPEIETVALLDLAAAPAVLIEDGREAAE
jgi:hypothetical protein